MLVLNRMDYAAPEGQCALKRTTGSDQREVVIFWGCGTRHVGSLKPHERAGTTVTGNQPVKFNIQQASENAQPEIRWSDPPLKAYWIKNVGGQTR